MQADICFENYPAVLCLSFTTLSISSSCTMTFCSKECRRRIFVLYTEKGVRLSDLLRLHLSVSAVRGNPGLLTFCFEHFQKESLVHSTVVLFLKAVSLPSLLTSVISFPRWWKGSEKGMERKGRKGRNYLMISVRRKSFRQKKNLTSGSDPRKQDWVSGTMLHSLLLHYCCYQGNRKNEYFLSWGQVRIFADADYN